MATDYVSGGINYPFAKHIFSAVGRSNELVELFEIDWRDNLIGHGMSLTGAAKVACEPSSAYEETYSTELRISQDREKVVELRSIGRS